MLTVVDSLLDLTLSRARLEFPAPPGAPGQGVRIAASSASGAWTTQALAVRWVDAAGARRDFDPAVTIAAGGGAAVLDPDTLVAVDRIAVECDGSESGALVRVVAQVEQRT